MPPYFCHTRIGILQLKRMSKTSNCAPKAYRWRVGYWISEKKLKKMNFDEFTSIARSANIELIKINLDDDLEVQGPYDAILHKLSDLLVLSDHGDSNASNLVGKLEKFLEDHPEIVVLDPFDCVRRLCDRYQQYTLIQDVCEIDNVCIPTFVDLVSKDVEENVAKLRQAKVQYPFICKPLVAHGSDYAHQMSIIFNEQSLKDVDPPCVAQTFIRHDAVLYKVFVVGDRYFIVPRPSLKNFKADCHPTIFFDSHAVSKEGCSSYLSKLDEEDKKRPAPRLLDERVGAVVRDIRRKTDISLFGLDFIVEKETGFHYIIDVNNFPSYDGVKYFYNYLVDLIVAALTEKELKLLTEKSNPLTAKSLDDSALLLHCSPSSSSSSTSKINPFMRTNRGVDGGDKIAATSKIAPASPKLTSTIDEPKFLLRNVASSTAATSSLRSASSKSMSEYLLDSGIGSSSCTESDNSDSERKLLKVLKLNQQRCRSAQQQTTAQKPSNSFPNEPSAFTTTGSGIVVAATTPPAPSVNIRTPRGRSSVSGAGGGAANEKFATISTPTAAYAERERQLRHEQLQQQQLAENWSRIKQFYGIPKPFFVKKMTGEF